jgi:tRNA(Ile)-lysidine synthase
MPALKEFAAGFHARPLLSVPRIELKHYAESYHLTWIEDESNANKHFTRNFLRHDVLPLLKQRWPTVSKTLARTAENCAETQQLVTMITMQDLAVCRDKQVKTLSIKKLQLLDANRQRQVLRAWLKELGFSIPSSAKLHQIQHDFLQAREDKLPYMTWNKIELRRYQDSLHAHDCLVPHDATQTYSWDLTQPLVIPNLGSLHAVMTENEGLHPDIKQVTVRFRQGGERCYFSKRRCHQSLKHLFQQWRIPPWERERIPLIFIDDTLAAVPGFFLDAAYASTPGRQFSFAKR